MIKLNHDIICMYCMYVCLDRQEERQVNRKRQIDRWMDGWMDRQIDRIDRWMDGWMDRQIDRFIEVCTCRCQCVRRYHFSQNHMPSVYTYVNVLYLIHIMHSHVSYVCRYILWIILRAFSKMLNSRRGRWRETDHSKIILVQ